MFLLLVLFSSFPAFYAHFTLIYSAKLIKKMQADHRITPKLSLRERLVGLRLELAQ